MSEADPLTKPCIFFARGHCERADDCPYLHDERIVRNQMGDRNVPTKPCPLYSQGVCLEEERCAYLHDERTVRKSTRVAIALRDFVRQHGGELCTSPGLHAFYRVHPDARDVIGGKIRKFCDAHCDLLRFQVAAGSGMILSVPLRAYATTCPETAAGSSSSSLAERPRRDIAMARCLRAWVQERGGHVSTRDLPDFYEAYPAARNIIGGGKLLRFCEEYPDLLRFQEDRGMILVSTVEDIEVAHKLRQYVQQQGGKIACGLLSGFYEAYPETKPICGGRVRHFCEEHKDLLRFDVRSGCIISVEHKEVELARLLRNMVDNYGGQMETSRLEEFYKEHPEAKVIIGSMKLRTFCLQHPDLLRLDTGNHMILSALVGDHPARPPQEEATLLRDFVETHGGKITDGLISTFYNAHPEARGMIGGRLRQFCQEHSDILRFQIEGGKGMVLSVSWKDPNIPEATEGSSTREPPPGPVAGSSHTALDGLSGASSSAAAADNLTAPRAKLPGASQRPSGRIFAKCAEEDEHETVNACGKPLLKTVETPDLRSQPSPWPAHGAAPTEEDTHATSSASAREMCATIEPSEKSSRGEISSAASATPSTRNTRRTVDPGAQTLPTAQRHPRMSQRFHTADAGASDSQGPIGAVEFVASAKATLERLINVHQQALKDMFTLKVDLDLAHSQLATREARMEAALALAASASVNPGRSAELANFVASCNVPTSSAASTISLQRTSQGASSHFQFVLRKDGRSKVVVASVDTTAARIVKLYGGQGSWELKFAGHSIDPEVRLCELQGAETLEFALEPDDF